MNEEAQIKLIEEITAFANASHGEQRRKYTDDYYIIHPVNVMKICKDYTDDILVLGAALLHDVLEDTPVSDKEIRTFLETILPPSKALKIVQIVIELTDVYTKKNYPALNRRARKEKEVQRLATCSKEAQTVKYADIIDNALNIVDHDHDFGQIYLEECKSILEKMDKGNPELYNHAITTVEESLNKIKSTAKTIKNL